MSRFINTPTENKSGTCERTECSGFTSCYSLLQGTNDLHTVYVHVLACPSTAPEQDTLQHLNIMMSRVMSRNTPSSPPTGTGILSGFNVAFLRRWRWEAKSNLHTMTYQNERMKINTWCAAARPSELLLWKINQQISDQSESRILEKKVPCKTLFSFFFFYHV